MTVEQPISVVAAVPKGGGIHFLNYDEQTCITGPVADATWKVLAQCDGCTTIDQIVNETQLDEALVRNILDDLEWIGVIQDSREQYRHFHRLTCNPPTYCRTLTEDQIVEHREADVRQMKPGETFHFEPNPRSQLYHYQLQRHSVRNFSSTPVTRDQLGQICDLGYNLTRHAVPSGGGLYPLTIFAVVNADQEDLPSGYYEYDAIVNTLVRFRDVDTLALSYIFDSVRPVFGSHIQIIIAADIARQPYKYANKGYLLTAFEVGQAAQNISLACVELGLASCELGGFLDDPLAEELQLEPDTVPMLTIAIGHESAEPERDEHAFLNQLNANYVGTGKPVSRVVTRAYPESSSYLAASRFGTAADDIAGASASSSEMAKAKAIVEGYERFRSQAARSDYCGSARELTGRWIDPRVFTPLTAEQLDWQGLMRFNEELKIEWTAGCDLDGNTVWVPTDMVFYGGLPRPDRIAWANSSGVAAFTTKQEAIDLALLELIERDALMKNWFARTAPEKARINCIPLHLQRRASYWAEQGRSVHFLIMPSPYAIVIQAVIVSDLYPFFLSGAAAAMSFEKACLKAFGEAEYGLVDCLHHPEAPTIQPDKVRAPADHRRLYLHKDHISNISWLWSGKDTKTIPETSYPIEDIRSALISGVVDLSEDGSPIKVVRVFSDKLVPIGFGYHSDHFTHSSIMSFSPASQALPHYFD